MTFVELLENWTIIALVAIVIFSFWMKHERAKSFSLLALFLTGLLLSGELKEKFNGQELTEIWWVAFGIQNFLGAVLIFCIKFYRQGRVFSIWDKALLGLLVFNIFRNLIRHCDYWFWGNNFYNEYKVVGNIVDISILALMFFELALVKIKKYREGSNNGGIRGVTFKLNSYRRTGDHLD